MDYTVTCHPVLEGTTRRPDFLAEKDERSIYIEARSASASDVSVGAAARVNTVYESLDRLDSPNFFLWIEVVWQGPGPLRAKPLRGRLERWLAGLDPENCTLGGRRDDRRTSSGMPRSRCSRAAIVSTANSSEILRASFSFLTA